jgi:hypothetical protein
MIDSPRETGGERERQVTKWQSDDAIPLAQQLRPAFLRFILE